MTEFLSEESILSHREHLGRLRLRYAILEDGIKSIKNKKYEEILRQKLNRQDRNEVLSECSDILLHEIYFNSFTEKRFSHSPLAVASFGSEAALLNKIFSIAKSQPYGFVCVYLKEGKVTVLGSQDRVWLLSFGIPRLAVDVSEHAYFLDYGFDKEKYLISALPYLDLGKLNS